MWQSEELLNHLETSSTIQSKPFVTAEWNMNVPSNILRIGNYRYRPYERLTTPVLDQSPFASLQNSYDQTDSGNFYTDATTADVVIDGGYVDSTQNLPATFKSVKEKENLLYSLEDCFGRQRPRSGICKVRYLETDYQYLNFANEYYNRRPRHYMAHKDDKFKYWTSYRTEDGQERGVAINLFGGKHYIDDAAPFVVYKNQVPTNRIIVKMQTGVGDVDLGPFRDNAEQFDDPFFGRDNMTVPERWSIQYLEDNNWNTAMTFDENFIRDNGEPLIGSDGYVEIYYGLKVPTKYKTFFKHVGEYASSSSLPQSSTTGYAYLVGATDNSPGEYYVWNGAAYDPSFVPEYAWQVKDEGSQNDYGYATNLVSPPKFVNPVTGKTQYRELKYVSGLRVVVETMTKDDSVFDLIELSPRLAADVTDRILSYSISKPASDLGVSGMPVGQLLASTGTMNMFDYDGAFIANNTNSIISQYTSQNIQFKVQEIIENVNGLDYYVPIKTMYSEGFPSINSETRQVSIDFRDLYFYFENSQAPQIFLTNVSMSQAVAILLDSIGFSNYSFKRLDTESDPVIPNFFVSPDSSIAEVLQDIAISTQSTMFFDEYNNFVVMSRGYIMPSASDRATDITLYGSKDSQANGAIRNETTGSALSNIIAIASQENKVFNAGTIKYSSRYIGRAASLSTSTNELERDKRWTYSLAELWNVASEKTSRIRRNGVTQEGGYALSAIPLASDLSDTLPAVQSNVIVNNVINLGEAVQFLFRYNGYFYANGEIIRYDAIQYSVPGLVAGENSEDGSTVWIGSEKEFEKYFSQIPFNGKMYPTGLIRIYAEPNYETINGITRLKPGAVAKHGRCQFGTGKLGEDGQTYPIYHSAGLDSYWSDNSNVRGVNMESKYLFTSERFSSSSFNISQVRIVSNTGLIFTLSEHDFEVGDTVYIEGVGQKFDGPHTITATDPYLFSYATDFEDEDLTDISSTSARAYVVKYDDPTSALPAGPANTIGGRSRRTGLVRNFLGSSYSSEAETSRVLSTDSNVVQSSALVFSGGTFAGPESPINYLSYVYKPLENSFKHFGTRLRIIGRTENDENRLQTPVGVMSFYGVSEPSPDQLASIGGASGGMGIMVDESKNTGYYFEIAALTANNVTAYSDSENISDVIFYKVVGSSGAAIPIKLWSGYAGILTNTGNEIGQGRIAAEENPSVYDLAVEYQDIGTVRRFYLYLNNSLIQVVDDPSPLPIVNNMALFIRGTSKAMFENIYALAGNYAQNTSAALNLPASTVFSKDTITADEAFRKYAISGVVQESYLSGISSAEPPAWSMYYDEFGTIMREAAYFNIRYSKAYPALIARLLPSFSKLKGYVTSGFLAGAYGAEFLMFNATDSNLFVGEEPNRLSIVGVTFTEESQQEYTVDDYFNNRADLSRQSLFSSEQIVSPEKIAQDYFNIKVSRMEHGRNEFTLDVPYLQSHEEAESLMSWMSQKIMKPRLSIGISLFPNPMIQLGDIVNISYSYEDTRTNSEYPVVVPATSRFVVYNIEYGRDTFGPSMTLYLSEVR